jgi:hypothetical protein
MVGFKIDEIMVGTHRVEGREDEKPMHFTITWGNKSLRNYLNPFSAEFLRADARGVITVSGIVNKAECMGSLRLLYFTERKIRYELEFADERGRGYRYIGEKVNIWPWNLHKSHTTCYGTITELAAGKVISKSIVYFPLRELMTFISSARLVFSENGRSGTTSHVGVKGSGTEQKGSYKVLSAKEARIIAAMAGGVIPRGGDSFALGAADLEQKWLLRADSMMSKMPAFTRLELKCITHLLNFILPALYMKRFKTLISMDEQERTKLFGIMEKSGFLGPVSILLVKILVFPAFYGLTEAKEAIGYQERFSNNQGYEGVKD